MVIDKIENSKLYAKLSERIAKAFAWLNATDLSRAALGKYEIEDQNIFAIIQEYDTKEIADCKLEGHYKYIDIQYIISGLEQMGVIPLTHQIPVEKNMEKDVAFYKSDSSLIRMESGMFAIFFPDDLHMPCIKFNQISKVKKVVIKVHIG